MNKEKTDNYYSSYGVSDKRYIREKIRKNKWLSHKTKFAELSYYSHSIVCFKSTHLSPHHSIEDAKNFAEHLEMVEEFLEVGVLFRTLILEKTGDELERKFSNLQRVMSALGNARTQSGGVITEHKGAELLMHNYERLTKEERSFLPPAGNPAFRGNAVSLKTFKNTLEDCIRIKDELEKWTTALKIHQQEEVA